MARSEARLQFNIWRGGLDGLSPNAKLLYVVLLTEPTINHAGVGAMRVALWARNASLTVAETQKALDELVDGTYLLMDDETEEVFVRTMIRNDGVWKQPYVLKGALQEALLTTSESLRRALAGELRKLPPKKPDGVSKAGKPVIYPDPHAAADLLDPKDSPPPVRKPSPDPSERVSEGSQDGSKTLGGRGRGRGRGISSSVGTSVAERADARADDILNKAGQKLARVYVERVPMSKFPAVFAIVKKALNANYGEADIEAALLRLVDQNRTVTVDALRIELDGPPRQLRAVAGGRAMPFGYDEHGQMRDPKSGVLIER